MSPMAGTRVPAWAENCMKSGKTIITPDDESRMQMKLTLDNLVQSQQTPRVSTAAGEPGPQTDSQSRPAPVREAREDIHARLSGEARSPFVPPGAAQGGEPVRISPAASRISTLALETPSDRPPPPTRLVGSVIESPPTDTALLADSLRNALSRSGLFYESHLARWLQGEKLLADILKEPQARLSALLRRARRSASSGPTREERGPSPKGDPEVDPWRAEDERQGLLGELSGLVVPETVPVVREQLSLLLSGMARLRGEAWPGQEMEWDVEKRDGETEQKPGSAWRTSIRLRLPNLGLVSAVITMNGNAIKGEITTESTAAVALMEREVETLERSLAACGLRLLGLVVGHGQENQG